MRGRWPGRTSWQRSATHRTPRASWPYRRPRLTLDDGFRSEGLGMAITGRSVADVMTTDPVVLDSGASLEAADIVLRSTFIKGIPVVDGQGRLVGTIGRRTPRRAPVRRGRCRLGPRPERPRASGSLARPRRSTHAAARLRVRPVRPSRTPSPRTRRRRGRGSPGRSGPLVAQARGGASRRSGLRTHRPGDRGRSRRR